MDGGYNGKRKGKDWVETVLGWTVEVVKYPPKIRGVWVLPMEEQMQSSIGISCCHRRDSGFCRGDG